MNEGISFAATLQVAEQGIRDGLHLGGQLHVLQHGRTLLDIALGQEQLGIRMRPGTLMTWLSSGKPLAALAVAQLCTRAQLQLDTRVAEVIPEFSVHGKEGITVRHVLTHTGGFRTADKCDLGDEWPAIIDCICNSAPDPQSQPRTRAAYHVSGSWYILGEIVRRLDGRPFEQYAAEEIFARSGSQDCFFRLDSAQFRAHESRLGWLYHTESGSPIPHRRWNSAADASLCRPGRSARGPIRELAKIYAILLEAREGNRAAAEQLGISPEVVRTFTARQRSGMFDDTFQHVVDWGLGFYVDSNRYGRESVPYGYGRFCSEETFGHSGAQSSCAFADPAHGVVVAWVFNGMPGERAHQRRARELNSAIYHDLGLAEAAVLTGSAPGENQGQT